MCRYFDIRVCFAHSLDSAPELEKKTRQFPAEALSDDALDSVMANAGCKSIGDASMNGAPVFL